MKYMLDTDISSYVMRHQPEALVTRFQQQSDLLCVSVVTEAELRYGACKRGSTALERAVERYLERLPVLDWDRQAASSGARLNWQLRQVGTPIGANDLMIAAHAMGAGLTLVTNNERHFRQVPGLHWENWLTTTAS